MCTEKFSNLPRTIPPFHTTKHAKDANVGAKGNNTRIVTKGFRNAEKTKLINVMGISAV
jgi:hypothetical protein